MTHCFDVEDAQRFGVNSAIVLTALRGWIAHNKANGKNQHDGRTWTYNSIKAWSKLIPYLTPKQIRSSIDLLEKAGVVVKGNYNSSGYDRTLWYALAEEKSIFPAGQLKVPSGENESAPAGNSLDQGGTNIDTIQSPPAPPRDGRHHAITSQWSERYRAAFEMTYMFAGRDAATLKRFLASNADTSEEILAVAHRAWERVKLDRFARMSKNAGTIHGLCTFYNDIRIELQSPQTPALRPRYEERNGHGALGLAPMR